MFDGMLKRRGHADAAAELPPTPHDIVAKVRRPAALVVAERNLQELRSRKRQVAEQERAQTRARIAGGMQAILPDAEMQALDAEKTAIIERVRPAFEAVAKERPAYIATVNTALADTRRDAAIRAAGAIAELLAAVDILDQCNAEVAAVGGEPLGHPGLPSLDALLVTMRRRGGLP